LRFTRGFYLKLVSVLPLSNSLPPRFQVLNEFDLKTGGYINEHGRLNVERLQLILNELGVFEREHFEYDFADANWFKGKQGGGGGGGKMAKNMEKAMETAKAKGKLGMPFFFFFPFTLSPFYSETDLVSRM